MIILKAPFDQAWENKDPFVEVSKLAGETYRAIETRHTLQFEFEGKGYFIKRHSGTTLKEVVKNLLTLKMPVLGADREWKAINHLKNYGIDTMNGVAFGQKGLNPIKRTSFIITEDLSPVIPLNEYCSKWATCPPSFEIKQAILERVATMTSKMHRSGLNHRDCYLCHFLLQLPFDGSRESLKISIIDLHRAQIRPSVPERWRNKDLIGLYFSSLDIGLTQRDLYRFLKHYFRMPLRDIFQKEAKFLSSAHAKAMKVKQHTIKNGL